MVSALVQPLTNPSVANPPAFTFSSDHSSVTHHFCQALSPRFHCPIIPITQWQCICFVSSNYSVTHPFFLTPCSASGKTRTQGSTEIKKEKKRILSPPGHELSGPATCGAAITIDATILLRLPSPLLYFSLGIMMKYCSLFFHILVLSL